MFSVVPKEAKYFVIAEFSTEEKAHKFIEQNKSKLKDCIIIPKEESILEYTSRFGNSTWIY